MRLFISIDLPQKELNYLKNIQNQLCIGKFFEGRLTKKEQLHITIKFIDQIEEKNISAIQNLLELISFEPFKICLGNLEVIVKDKQVRLIWITVLSKQLALLVQQIENILEPFVAIESRSYTGHITLARVTAVKDRQQLITHLNAIDIDSNICFITNEFNLKQSVLFQEGSEYHIIETFPLMVKKEE
ncbi:MAG: RNA 2',3'-cyclic phosphodiesterase [Candidatus Babeliales bacterium]